MTKNVSRTAGGHNFRGYTDIIAWLSRKNVKSFGMKAKINSGKKCHTPKKQHVFEGLEAR